MYEICGLCDKDKWCIDEVADGYRCAGGCVVRHNKELQKTVNKQFHETRKKVGDHSEVFLKSSHPVIFMLFCAVSMLFLCSFYAVFLLRITFLCCFTYFCLLFV